MDPHSYRVLEFDRVKEMIAGFAAWSRGRDFALGLEPFNSLPKLKARQDEVAEAMRLEENDEGVPLESISDISEHLSRAEKGGILSGEDLLEVKAVLELSGLLVRFFSVRKDMAPALATHAQHLYRDTHLLSDLKKSLTAEGRLNDDASGNLSRIRKSIKSLDDRIREKLEKLFRSTGYHAMMQEPLITSRDGRWVVPVKSEYKSQFPGLLIDKSSSGATVFMEPWLVVDMGNTLREAKLEEKKEEELILTRLSGAVAAVAGELRTNLDILAHIDLIAALSEFAKKFRATVPEINTRGHLKLEGARHPLLTVTPVPVDIELGSDFRTLVLTGPNTGGKTVTLKIVGLFCLMALSGIPVPAEGKCRVPMFSKIFADIGDEQSIVQNLSTFSAHVTKLIMFLDRADENSLVLIDELGAGTDPVEGTALGIAILEYLHKKGARTLVSTHYGEIKSFASHYPGVQNAAMEFDEDTLQPLFKIKIGVPGRSCAFEVARRLGMSEELVVRARDFMKAEHLALEDLVRSVEREEEALRHERIKVEEIRQKQSESLETIRAESEQARSRATSELRDLIDETSRELKEITSGYRGIALPGKKKFTRKQMKEAEDQSRTRMDEVIERLAEKTGLEIEKQETVHDLSVGDIVEVPSMKQRGTVIGIDDGDRVEVRIGQFRMWFGGSDLVKVEVSLTGNEEFDELRREKVLNTRPELNLRGQRLEEALESLAKYIDDAMLAGLSSFRVVHGKGQGVLKKAVGQYLENNPCVADYHLADTSEGSWGATVVDLK